MVPRLSEIALAPLAPPDGRECSLIAGAARYLGQSSEEWYHRTRRKYGHSRLLLEPVILKPVCDDCLASLDLPTSLDRCWKSTEARDIEVGTILICDTEQFQEIEDVLRPVLTEAWERLNK